MNGLVNTGINNNYSLVNVTFNLIFINSVRFADLVDSSIQPLCLDLEIYSINFIS